MTERVPLFVFMSPGPEQLRQTRDDCADEPKWFAYPIEKAGFELHFKPRSKAGLWKLGRLTAAWGELCALIFTIGPFEAAACAMFGHRLRICSLFQWRALENLPFHQRLCYRRILHQSRVIAVYDAVSEHYVRKMYPRKRVVRIGLFADTEFFRPAGTVDQQEDYVLCPGSHFRLEHVVIEIARQLPLKVIRYSNEPSVRAFYRRHPDNRVDFRYNISYAEIRRLMNRAAFVLNVVDDTQVPAGIYTFCQALSMNQVVVTPDMHSCSGYELEGKGRPYHTIHDPFRAADWVAISRRIIQGELVLPGSPRELAETWCSLQRSTSDWKRIKEMLMD